MLNVKSLCPICGRSNCQHTRAERGQTLDEEMRDLTNEEKSLLGTEPEGSEKVIALAKKNAHLSVPPWE